jgi:hypothetical protein
MVHTFCDFPMPSSITTECTMMPISRTCVNINAESHALEELGGGVGGGAEVAGFPAAMDGGGGVTVTPSLDPYNREGRAPLVDMGRNW